MHIVMVLYMLINYTHFLFIILMYFLPLYYDYHIVCIHASIRMGYNLLNIIMKCLVVSTLLDEKIR